MALFHKIQSLPIPLLPPFFSFNSIYGNFTPPVSLQIREISALTIEDTFLGMNPQFPYSITISTWTNENSKTLIQRIISDVQDILQQPHPLYNIEELRREIKLIEFHLVEETQVANFFYLVFEMVKMEVIWLNAIIQSNPYLQQINIVEKSHPQLVHEITTLADKVDGIYQNILEASNIPLLPNGFQTPMDINDDNIFDISSLPQFESTYDSTVIVSLNELREIVHCFVGKRLTAMWNYQKQLEAVGIPFYNPLLLEKIGPQCQRMYKSFLDILEILQSQFDQQSIFLNKACGYFQIFLQAAFFVYQQPPLVIQTVTKMCEKQVSRDDPSKEESIPVSTCLLPAPGINLKETTTMYSINEKCLKTLYADGLDAMLRERVELEQFYIGEPKRRINQSSCRNIVIAEFDGAKLVSRNGKRNSNGSSSKQGQIKVVEEKCCVLFVLQVEKFKIWTTSLPVSISSHGVQKGLGMAVIIRDYLSAGMIRTPCEILSPGPEYITWDELSKVIVYFFRKLLGNWNLHLTDGDLIGIKRKAVGAAQLAHRNDGFMLTSEEIRWAHLCENVFLRPAIANRKIHELKFCFWDWVHAAIKTLLVPRVTQIWEKGFLRFIDKQKKTTEPVETSLEEYKTAECELRNGGGRAKTFLLRFSDNYPGAISIVFVGDDGLVYHNPPFMLQEIKENSLANAIKADNKLLYIHGCGVESTKNVLLADFYPEARCVPGYSH